jgi:pyruvate-ferredoxin/flavodoxin oxidoreductase
MNEAEKKNAPASFESKKAIGKGLEGLEYRIAISPFDCTGCGNCAQVCPAPKKALEMKSAAEQQALHTENWKFAMTVTDKDNLMEKSTLKGSQFARPLMEFSGACAGCGETPYVKLITQLFGDRMMIANATGCSSIWGASAPSVPYTTNACGQGPAWANSLFEDNAEFGLGMHVAVEQIREKLTDLMNESMNTVSPELAAAFAEWIAARDNAQGSKIASNKIVEIIKNGKDASIPAVAEILEKKDFLIKKSQWIFGGDGWAYDIGFGGLDHVIASGDNVNILVMDTEVYSNTGGQSSKATPTAAVAKFAASGKKIRKKDLGMIAMSYGYVYVAQIAMGANMNQALKAIAEAEAYNGPSVIIAYAPCVNHGIKTGMGTTIAEEKKAVETGYWHLYRFNPTLKAEGKNPFVLESKEPNGKFMDFINGEIRYTSLKNTFPGIAEEMFKAAEEDSKERYLSYKRMAEMQF